MSPDNPKTATPRLCESLFRDKSEHEIRDILLRVHAAERAAKTNRELLANMLGILVEASGVKIVVT